MARLRRPALLLAALAVAASLGAGAGAPAAPAMTSHAGWPEINGMLLMNKDDSDRPLDARPGRDPFGGTDPTYSCDTIHVDSTCVGQPPHCIFHESCIAQVFVPDVARHNELLGGHGSDTIHAGPWGDVLWGDYKTPADGDTAQPTTQVDRLWGGPGKDFIYASHGRNIIRTGGGADVVHAHFGRGSITCANPAATVFISRRALRRYRLHGCPRVSFRTLGY